jgi:rhodanese-related sulfurtransferase
MASWNSKLDQKWKKNSGNNPEIVETTPNPKAEAGSYPEIYTGMSDAESILEARVNEVVGMGIGNAKISLDDLSQSLEDFYIVNYWPEEMYNEGHIKTALQYTPRKSLHTSADLATLPIDRPIAVYCYSGQHSAAVVAYLRVLGYDAYTLLYGANAFMNKKLVETNNHGFSSKLSNNFELETSEYVEPEGGVQVGGGC